MANNIIKSSKFVKIFYFFDLILIDTQIASIAIANQMILVTRNLENFEPMQKVSGVLYLENWFEE